MHRPMDLGILAAAVVVDVVWGEPPAAYHPVVWIGRYISFYCEYAYKKARPLMQLLAGLVLVVTTITLAAGFWGTLLSISYLSKISHFLVGVYITKSSFAMRELLAAAGRVEKSLELHDIAGARASLRELCSREAANLDDREIGSAVAGSLAENLSDSVVAPLFYFVLFGPIGALLYRVINTMDAMVGYRGKYEYFGKIAARLDDVVNVVPARLTAIVMLACARPIKGDFYNGLTVLWRDRLKTASWNAGWPMAAAAGILNIVIAKKGVYSLGDADRAISGFEAIQISRRLIVAAMALTVVFMGLLLFIY